MKLVCEVCGHEETIEGNVSSPVLCRRCYQADIKAFMEPVPEREESR